MDKILLKVLSLPSDMSKLSPDELRWLHDLKNEAQAVKARMYIKTVRASNG